VGAGTGETPPIFRPSAPRAPLVSAATYNVLAVRVAFTDTPIDSSTAYYDRRLLFLNQYWNQVSDGQVTITPTLWDSVFTLPHTMGYYGDDDRFQERLVYLVRDMVAAADSTVDFHLYQAIIIFHAGAGQEADVLDDSREQIWSAFVTPDDFEQILPDSTGAVGIKTNDQISPGVFYRVKEAVEVPEVESQDGYAFGSTGVLCHEFGHQLGRLVGQISMPDLYDTTPDEGGYSQGIGSWDIMGGGVWNANGFVPAGPSAWTRLWLGFLAPTRVTVNGPQNLGQLERQVSADPRTLQVPITQSEYFLLENRRRDLDGNGKFTFDDVNQDGCFDFYTDSYAGAEFDFFLPANMTEPSGVGCDAGSYVSGDGIVIYHVDDAKIEATLATNTVEGDVRRKGIDVVEADGVEDLDGPPSGLAGGSPDDVFRAGWRDHLTPDTTPSTAAYPNVRTGISFTAISAADSVMSVDVSFDRTRAGWPKVISNARIRNLPPVAADLDGNGVLELVVAAQRLNNTGAIYIFEPDGTNFLGGGTTPTAFAITASAPTSSPCVGDIDGVAGVEIVFQTLNGAIYAYHPNGTEVMDGDGDAATTGILQVPLVGVGTNAQPMLADLNGDGALDIVTGSTATGGLLGGSILRVVSISGGLKSYHTLPMGGSTEGPPAAADLNGDGLPEVIVSNVATIVEDNALNGLSIANWDILNDGTLPKTSTDFYLYEIHVGGPFSAPVLSDVDRDGTSEVMLADRSGAFHAFRLSFSAHIPGDGNPPNEAQGGYVHVAEIPGWPTTPRGPGRISEVSLGDLEKDGYPELLHIGDDVRVEAIHYNGAPRSGYPIQAAAPYASADTAGFWPPLVADVDGDGIRDVIAILPDGRRPAYRADGSPIRDFVELGSTGASAPPMLLDLDGDGTAEWIEAYDVPPTQSTITMRSTPVAIPPSAVAWGQYRNSATRNAVLPAGPAGPGGGTQNLTAVYAYPNPSHTGTTTIHYRLAEAATSVSVRILDPTGATVAELPVGAGNLAGSAEHAVPWDHRSVASGVYLCRVEVRSSKGTEVQFASLAVVR
jgi:M6 family metalloprotease-like protein